MISCLVSALWELIFFFIHMPYHSIVCRGMSWHGIESCHCASQSHFHRNQINLAQFEWKMLLAEKIVSNDREIRDTE